MQLAIVAALLLVSPGQSFTFVRHAETVANSTGVYNSKTLNVLSKKGADQVLALTDELRGRRFDVIVVSPSPRALLTIAPYLRESGQVATVWPLLYECCTGKHSGKERPTKFSYSGAFELPKGVASLFRIDPASSRLPVAPDFSAGLAQVEASVTEFSRYHSRGKVLVVGHSGHGGQFIYRLSGRRLRVENAVVLEIAIPER